MREVRRGGERFRTDGEGTRTWHSFSYGAHYDPDNLGFGALQAINEEHVAPGAGYDEHRHRDVEIVTWVLEGALAHADTTGAQGVIEPGTAQRLSAGTGVEHAERNASQLEPLVFVQVMLRSEHAAEPRYACVDVEGPGLLETVDVAADARLLVARPDGGILSVPPAPRTLVHTTRGPLVVDGLELGAGDEVRTDEPVERVAGHGEALLWLLR
ncbi:pirin family protein [Aeromicrobium sp. CTD01-1L150]|uniref:pirin family protein n=1 Tax=Aeromicrobium sp. CTD01-1L150 TaxID=3341830 RepID=UPI0035C21708